jgi:protein TonB
VRLREPEPPPEEEEEISRPLPEPRKPVTADTFQPELFQPRFEKLEMPALNLRVDTRIMGAPSDIGLKLYYNAEDLDQPPRAIAKVPPLYPYRAKRMEIEGYVKVRFLVDKKGAVTNITVLESQPEGVFESSVKKILPTWRFNPGKIMGEPVSSWVVTTIRFELG